MSSSMYRGSRIIKMSNFENIEISDKRNTISFLQEKTGKIPEVYVMY